MGDLCQRFKKHPPADYNLIDRLTSSMCYCFYRNKRYSVELLEAEADGSIKLSLSNPIAGDILGYGIMRENGNLQIFDDSGKFMAEDNLYAGGTSFFQTEDQAYQIIWPDRTAIVPSRLQNGMDLQLIAVTYSLLNEKLDSPISNKVAKIMTCLVGINQELANMRLLRHSGIQEIHRSLDLRLNFQNNDLNIKIIF